MFNWFSAFVLALSFVGQVAMPTVHVVTAYEEEAGESSKCANCKHTFNDHDHHDWNMPCLHYNCECTGYVPTPIVT